MQPKTGKRVSMFHFLDASSHFYKRPCPSVGPSCWSVGNAFIKYDEKWPFQILNDLDSTGEEERGRRDEEERATRRKERRGE